MVTTGKTRTSWRLIDAAQRRLDDLERPLGPLGVEQLIYLDYLCADCHDRTLTRLDEDLYLCDTCRARRGAQVTEKEVPAAPPWQGGHLARAPG